MTKKISNEITTIFDILAKSGSGRIVSHTRAISLLKKSEIFSPLLEGIVSEIVSSSAFPSRVNRVIPPTLTASRGAPILRGDCQPLLIRGDIGWESVGSTLLDGSEISL